MKNYKIHTDEREQAWIINLLNQSNDIIINNVEPTGIGITVQRDDADVFFENLLLRIQEERTKAEVIVVQPRCNS